MSVKIMGAVYDCDLPRDEKYVLLSYADHAAHDGTSIFPSIERMAWKTGYSERSIQSITRKLEQRGILVSDGKGPNGVNRWRIDIEMLPKREPYQSQNRGANFAGCKKQQEGVQKTTQRGANSAPNPSLTVINHQYSANAELPNLVLEEEKPPPKKKTTKPRDNTLYQLARALAQVCCIDYESNKPKLFAEAKRLSKATPTPTPGLVRLHYLPNGTWFQRDWRGKQGNRPTLGQVRLTWAQLVTDHEQSVHGLDLPSPVPGV